MHVNDVTIFREFCWHKSCIINRQSQRKGTLTLHFLPVVVQKRLCVSLSLAAVEPDVVRNTTYRGDGCVQKAKPLRASLPTSAEVGARNSPPQELQAPGHRHSSRSCWRGRKGPLKRCPGHRCLDQASLIYYAFFIAQALSNPFCLPSFILTSQIRT